MTRKAESLRIAIRAAQFSDAARLAPLASQLGYASTPEQVAARLPGIFAHPEHVVFVAEREDGELAGYVDVFLFRGVAADPRAEIAGLVVEEAARGQNIGRMLMARAEDWARENGCSECSLRSNVIREAAHRFYENLGYRVNKTQKSFRKTL
ncbi:MAG TPA: GNAT family N-acetyltransferase [Candidatus Acidoferrales bacterium]|nr:GNAT family N-acetyltransferase [Candidatus Acidoferrales bacterium]